MEKMDVRPFPSVETVFGAMKLNLQQRPDSPLFGSIKKKGEGYEWLTWKQSMQRAQEIAAGMERLDLVTEMEAEGRKWKFFGI